MTVTTPAPEKARYIMIGGFLGSGKTTSVARLAQQLAGVGLQIGLITNDQGSGLVDTATLRARGFATEEIPGGCFCCRFNSLLEAAGKLTAATRPDVFIAEPVGSCTDLVATVTYPLRRMYGQHFTTAPLSVLVDPIRASRMLGLATGGSFSPKVLYIYRKQLEEADLIVVNKTDLLSPDALAALQNALRIEFPRATVLSVSARTGAGLDEWFEKITATEQTTCEAMDIDYSVYAEGEALLGWLNSTIQVTGGDAFDGNAVLQILTSELQRRLSDQAVEIAHLKMTLSPDVGLGGLAVINLVRNDFVPELAQRLDDQMESGQLIINLRAEAAPETLEAALRESLAAAGSRFSRLAFRVEHLEHFRPGKPQPTHRLTMAS